MRLGRRGTAALEFAIVAPVLLALMFSGFESARYFWTRQALQLAADQTARCVGIGNNACATASTYAVNTAASFGAKIDTSAVAVATVAAPGTASCAPPLGTSAARVQLTANFTSPFQTLVPFLSRQLVAVSCYPLAGS